MHQMLIQKTTHRNVYFKFNLICRMSGWITVFHHEELTSSRPVMLPRLALEAAVRSDFSESLQAHPDAPRLS